MDADRRCSAVGSGRTAAGPRPAEPGRATPGASGRPAAGKEIDPLLTGRVLVVGDDADLAAVALRLLRRELLDAVVVGYAPASADAGHRAVVAADRGRPACDLAPRATGSGPVGARRRRRGAGRASAR